MTENFAPDDIPIFKMSFDAFLRNSLKMKKSSFFAKNIAGKCEDINFFLQFEI